MTDVSLTAVALDMTSPAPRASAAPRASTATTSAAPMASAAPILRAMQKDASFVSLLNAAVSDVVHGTMGGVFWVRHHTTLTSLTQLVYQSLTSLSRRQTLGEEYTGLLQMDREGQYLPKPAAQLMMVLLDSLGPLFLRHTLQHLHQALKPNGSLYSFLRPDLTSLAQSHVLPGLRHVLATVHRAHLALFYVQGAYYNIANRVAGVRYRSVRPLLSDTDTDSTSSLRLLGKLSLLQLLIELLLAARRHYKAAKTPQLEATAAGAYVPPSVRCPLCLCARTGPSLALCGHVFCYDCLHKAVAAQGHCPLCRYPMESRQVIPLVNYT